MTRVLVFNGALADEDQPYGLQHLAEHGFTLVHPPRGHVPSRVIEAVYHRKHLLLHQPGVLAARKADLVLAYLEPSLGWPALLKGMPGSPLRRLPLVAIVCWAAERLTTADAAARERLLRSLHACDLIGYWSRNQTAIFTAAGIPADRLVQLTFGVSSAGLVPPLHEAPDRDIDVLAVGMDLGRDYATLVAAADGAAWTLRLVAPGRNVEGLRMPVNVQLSGSVSFDEYLTLLHRARVVVVPTHELAYPTGQTVALEAAAAGCAVVVTGTAAMSEYFTDGVTALMPPPGDVGALRAAIDRLVGDPAYRHTLAVAGQEHVLTHHDRSRMWGELAAAIRSRRLG